MKTLKYFFQKAKREKWALGQFNFSTLEQLKGVIEAARETKAPVILGTSEGEVSFFGMEEAVLLRNHYRKSFPYIYLNLDHGRDIKLIKKAIDLSYDCVHFDGSDLLLNENIKKAKEIVKYARQKGVLIEGEIKAIKGSSETQSKIVRTGEEHCDYGNGLESIEQAINFIKETGIDSLAINIGNIHGTYLRPIRLNIELLKEINKNLPVFLVLHGGSGTRETDIKKAIKNGIVKININTELRQVWKKSLLKSLKKETIKPYKILLPVIEAIKEKTKEKIKLFEK